MIAVDTSVIVSFFEDEHSAAVEKFKAALASREAKIPPPVISEILSNPKLDTRLRLRFEEIGMLPVEEGYWQRAGMLRAKVIARGFKARLADALIAQSCIDHDVPLLTADGDFRHYVKAGGLRLAK